MIKRTVKYNDWDGEPVVEDLYFHLSKAELLEFNKKYGGALDKSLRRMIEKKQTTKLGVFFKDFILKAYGVKSEDGKRFEKSDEAAKAFYQSVAFSTLFDDVLSSAGAAEAFVDGVLDSIVPATEKPNVVQMPQE